MPHSTPPPGFRSRDSGPPEERREERISEGPPPFGLDGGVANPGVGEHYPYQRPYPYNPPCAVLHGDGPDIERYALIDFTMQVGNTGINFVAGLTGWRESDGSALFLPGATDAAFRRAASTLAFMSLVSGQTFLFLRTAQNLTQAQAATICGVSVGTIASWENGLTPVIITAWQTLADMACKADQRAGITWTAAAPVSFRPRTIRIYPDIPYKAPPPPPPCPPCPPC